MAHGKVYRQAHAQVDREHAYPPAEAVKLLKELPGKKFTLLLPPDSTGPAAGLPDRTGGGGTIAADTVPSPFAPSEYAAAPELPMSMSIKSLLVLLLLLFMIEVDTQR